MQKFTEIRGLFFSFENNTEKNKERRVLPVLKNLKDKLEHNISKENVYHKTSQQQETLSRMPDLLNLS